MKQNNYYPTVAATSELYVSPFKNVGGYIQTLQALVLEPSIGTDWQKRCSAALNGEAGKELRRAIPIDVRRKFGVFFTGVDLSTRLVSHSTPLTPKSIFYDPTCGMGDLLLAAAKLLPLGRTLKQTLRNWGHQLAGTDLHAEFIEGAKTRLVLLARQRHGTGKVTKSPNIDFFPHIRVANGLTEHNEIERATIILMNPPFGAVPAPNGCKWASGRITEAASFMISALDRAKPGTEILAILPDVLRSGSFSENWRSAITELAEVHIVEPYGVFDESADVDVFLVRLVRRNANAGNLSLKWPTLAQKSAKTVADFFDVHIGRVVPHRDKKAGPSYAYIHARCVPPWTVMSEFPETLEHEGKAYRPPFVVIRRTSRPEQAHRAIATVIKGKYPVAVENHLIVCEPKDGKLATCKELMKQLRTAVADEYLNVRIRCRHLTVGAINDVPFTEIAP